MFEKSEAEDVVAMAETEDSKQQARREAADVAMLLSRGDGAGRVVEIMCRSRSLCGCEIGIAMRSCDYAPGEGSVDESERTVVMSDVSKGSEMAGGSI